MYGVTPEKHNNRDSACGREDRAERSEGLPLLKEARYGLVLQLQHFVSNLHLQMQSSSSAVQSIPEAAPVLAKAVVAAAGRLGLRNRQLAAIIGTSEASVSRLRSGRGLDPERKEGELALLFLRLYRSLDALVGGDDAKARAWLHGHNHHLGGVPAGRIQTVEGLIDVVQYLDAMRGRL